MSHPIQADIRKLAANWSIHIANLQSARQCLDPRERDLHIAAAHLTVAGSAYTSDRLPLLSMLVGIDEDIFDCTAVNLIAADLERLMHDINNLATMAKQIRDGVASPRVPAGDTKEMLTERLRRSLNLLISEAVALQDRALALVLRERCIGCATSASHLSEATCPCHAG